MALEMNPSLTYLFEEKGVDAETIEKLKTMGINTLGRFSLWADDRKELRKVLKEDLGMDPDVDKKHRVGQIAVVDAWEAVKTRLDEQCKKDA